jgi:hypothetical protein
VQSKVDSLHIPRESLVETKLHLISLAFIPFSPCCSGLLLASLSLFHLFSFKAIKERKLTRQTLKENNKISTSDANDVGIKKRQAFLDLLLDGNENENQLLSDDDIRHEVNTFMFAVSARWGKGRKAKLKGKLIIAFS